MDDKTFDDFTAAQWIAGIEAAKESARDKDLFPAVRSWVERGNFKNILDVGSGQGICCEKIDITERMYTGVEPSPLMTKRARELYPRSNCSFVEGNIYALPFPERSFDGVFSILVWHLLGDLNTAASELARVLAPGGQFLIITANPDSYEKWKSYYKDFRLDGKCLTGTMELPGGGKSTDTLYLHTMEDILDSFGKVSLNVSRTETFRPSGDGTRLFMAFEGSNSHV